MHLVIADLMLADSALPHAARARINANLPAFHLGHTAPDAQTVSGQTREATHFFTVPITEKRPAYQTLLYRHPELRRPAGLAPARAAFVTGYLCHLALDQLWISTIFEPVFGVGAQWADFRERLFLHNVLRTYLDQDDLPRLNGAGLSLSAASPAKWLSFLPDDALCQWRDLLTEQLRPGGATRTIEIFAQRMNRDPAELKTLLDSPEALQRLIFARLPAEQIAAFRAEGLATCLAVAAEYWEA